MESGAQDFEGYPRADEHADQGPDISGEAMPVKADVTKRFVAGLIDAVVAILVGFIPIIGGLIGMAYWLVRDGMDLDFMDRRSIGKKLVKLRPLRNDGKPMDIETSAKRNLPFAVGGLISILIFIPIIGWIMIPFVGLLALGLLAVEAFLVVTSDDGRRFGDKFAETYVVEENGTSTRPVV